MGMRAIAPFSPLNKIMSKRKKATPVVIDGYSFPSQTEAVFYCWLKEARGLGIVSSFFMQETYELYPRATFTETIQLKTKTKIVERTLFQPWTYTPDFQFYTDSEIPGLKVPRVLRYSLQYTVDTKGDHLFASSAASFSHKQKAMWYRFKTYVNRVQPSKFYPLAGFPSKELLPDECWTISGKKQLRQPWRRLSQSSPSIKEVFAQQELGI